MKKIGIVLVAIVLLSTSCLNSPTGGSTTGTKYDATQDAKIANLEGIVLGPNGLQALVGNIQGKISGISDVPSLIARVTALDSRVAAVEARPVGGTGGVTQASVDALSARIKTLEDWKASAGTGTDSGSSAVPVTGQVTYRVYKEPDLIYTPGSFAWYLEIMNGTTEYKKVYISAILNTVDTHLADLNITDTKLNSPDLIGGLSDSSGPFSMNFVPASGVDASMMSGMSTGYVIIKGGEKKLVVVLLTLAYTSSAVSRWEAVWSLNPQKYP